MKICPACQHVIDQDGWLCGVCGYAPALIHGYPAFAPELATLSDSYESEFFAELARLEAGHFWFESRSRLLIWALRRYFPDARNFLEIGCGTGFVLQGLRSAFPHVRLAGSDILSAGLVHAARRVPDASFFQMDACSIPFAEEFDIIGVFDVLEHIEDDERALAQLWRATRSGGGIIVTVPQHDFMWSAVDEYSHHKRRYSRSELSAKMTQAGFAPLWATSFVSLLLPAMIGARAVRATHGSQNFDLYAEFKISSLLNNLFTWVMSIEHRLIQLGVSFPIGGSLLMIAHRR